MWTGLDSIISRKRFARSSIDVIQDAFGKSLTDPVQMSNIFNEYFVNVPDNIEKLFQERQILPLVILAVLLETLCFLLQSLI